MHSEQHFQFQLEKVQQTQNRLYTVNLTLETENSVRSVEYCSCKMTYKQKNIMWCGQFEITKLRLNMTIYLMLYCKQLKGNLPCLSNF